MAKTRFGHLCLQVMSGHGGEYQREVNHLSRFQPAPDLGLHHNQNGQNFMANRLSPGFRKHTGESSVCLAPIMNITGQQTASEERC